MNKELASQVLTEFANRNQGTKQYDDFLAKFNSADLNTKTTVLTQLAEKYQIGSPTAAEHTAGMKFIPDTELTPGKELVKGAAEQLPAIGAIAGGLAGGTSSALASFGLAAPAGAVVGAATGGALGTSFKNAILSLVQPEAAPQNIAQGLASAAGGAVEGAATEMGGQVVGKALGTVVPAAAKLAKKASQKIGFTAIPNVAKIEEKLTAEQFAKLPQLMDDYAVTTTTGTKRMLADKVTKVNKEVGKQLESAYANADKISPPDFTQDQIVAQLVPKMQKLYESTGKRLPASLEKKISSTVYDYFPNASDITHSALNKTSTTLSGTYNAELGTFNKKLAQAIKQVNGELIEQAGPEAYQSVRQLSSTYRSLETVRTELLRDIKPTSNFEKGVRAVKYGAAVATKNPLVIAGMAAKDVVSTTPVKTGSAALLKYTSNLLAKAPQLGPKGKVLLRIAGAKGYEAALKFHAYELVNNPKYYEAFAASGGFDKEKEDGQ